MTPRHKQLHAQLQEDLAQLKLGYLLEHYSEVLDEAARKNTSMLEVLGMLVGGEATSRAEKAMQRRIGQARLPKPKALEEYDFSFPKRISKQKVLRLFDCQFVAKHGCAVLVGGTGTGKTHLVTALGYVACEKGIRVRFTRVIDMINVLTTAQINGMLERKLREYVRPSSPFKPRWRLPRVIRSGRGSA